MSAPPLPRLAITPGEPAGIGPELVAKLAATDLAADLVAIADPELISAAAESVGVTLDLKTYDGNAIAARKPGEIRIVPMSLNAPATPGTLDPRNAAYVLATLAR